LSDGFRGGRQARRDRWFGLKRRDGFDDFARWWHRRGKQELNDGRDIEDRKQAEEMWDRWHMAGRPTVK